MTKTQTLDSEAIGHAHTKEKKAVAISSMAASAAMTIGKFIVGTMTGSLGLISEALHSFLDFGATVLTYLAVRVSDKPADAEHHYGHGKIEAFTALAETLLLFITSIWIIYEAIHRLMAPKIEVEATIWSFVVIISSILIDIWRAHALMRTAKKTKSMALEADALHFSSDVLSSSVVLVGLGFVAMGFPIGDPIAAIGVSIFVCRAGWMLGRRTFDTLIDTAPAGAAERIAAIVRNVPGVVDATRVRLRPAGSVLFVDIDASIGRGLSQSKAAALRDTIVDAIAADVPEAEVTVTQHPLALDDETIQQRALIIAANHGAQVHHITAHWIGPRLSVSFDLELNGKLPLAEAHQIASHLEADMRSEFGQTTEVESHIEPLEDRTVTGEAVEEPVKLAIAGALTALAAESGDLTEIHNVRVRRTGLGLIVIFHCRTQAFRTVSEIHHIVDDMERKLRATVPGIWRTVAHAEPLVEPLAPQDE
jgi:cation diffusion facilitator family transporter